MPKIDWDDSNDTPAAPRDALPPGRYAVMITASAAKRTKSGTGSMLEFEFGVISGEYKGRKLWARMNVHNANEVAQNIGRSEFKALRMAVGDPDQKVTEKLHGKKLVVLVKVTEGEKGAMNDITGYESLEEARARAAQSGSTPPPAKAAARPAPKVPAKPAPAEDDDDIPF